MSSELVVGVDGCPGGWVAVAASDGRFERVTVCPNLVSLTATFPGAKIFAIDIPLSYPQTYPRSADVEARRRLGRRGSSLFPVLPREVLTAATYSQSIERAHRIIGKGISKQSYALRAKIMEADKFLAATRDPRYFEVHPELSFSLLSEQTGLPIDASKKSWNGFAERITALEAIGMEPPIEPLEHAARAGVDDVIDAAVAAWTAQRLFDGRAISFPPDLDRLAEKCANGWRGAIWA